MLLLHKKIFIVIETTNYFQSSTDIKLFKFSNQMMISIKNLTTIQFRKIIWQ